MSCSPSYQYVPEFTPGADCSAPVYAKHRARALITPVAAKKSTSLFIRSTEQSNDANLIEVEQTETNFLVYLSGTLLESYPSTPFTVGAIAALRALLADSVVELPALGVDKYDIVRTVEEDGDGEVPLGGGEAVGGLAPFPRTPLTGGQGAPTTAAEISTIRTGPSRTMYVIASEEDVFGEDIQPQSKVMQWNGSAWVGYCNSSAGDCPSEGTC